jgi:hypothetical protein
MITDMSSVPVETSTSQSKKQMKKDSGASKPSISIISSFSNSGLLSSATALIPGKSNLGDAAQQADKPNLISHKYRFRAQIVTVNDGYNSGRKYYIKTDSEDTHKKIMEVLARKAKKARSIREAKTKFEKVRDKAAIIYASWPFQYFFAFLIATNFAFNVAEMQLVEDLLADDGSLSGSGSTFYNTDLFFTLMFAFELAFNLFAHPLRIFFNSGWNWFDAIVLSMSLTAYGPVQVIHNYIHTYIHITIHVSIHQPLASMNPSIHPSIHLSIYPSIHPCIITPSRRVSSFCVFFLCLLSNSSLFGFNLACKHLWCWDERMLESNVKESRNA